MNIYKSMLVIFITLLISFVIIEIKNNREWKWDQCYKTELQVYKSKWDEHCRLLGQEENCELPSPTSDVIRSEYRYRLGLCSETN